MQHRKTISLTSKDDAYIAAQLKSGAFGNASEVVRAGLRALEQEQMKLAALRASIAAGDVDFERGDVERFTGRGQLARSLKSKLGKTARKR